MKEVKSLSGLSGVWRVDGVGEVKIYERSVPRVKIALSQIKQEGIHAALVSGQATGEQKYINEPLNRIADLLVGSCWEGGVRVNKLAPFEGVRYKVDTNEVRFYRPGDSINLGGKEFLNALPSGALKLDKNYKYLNNSLYAVVPVLSNKETEYLVVPCSELYRFYIGVSKRFTNTIIRNALDEYVDWNSPILRVKTRLSRMEQFIAYRGFCSDVGKNWLRLPSNHIKSTAISNGSNTQNKQLPLTLKATFPFEGTTTLTIAGKRFCYRNAEGDMCWAVFAANIIKCGHIEDFDPIIESDVYSADYQSGGGEFDPEDHESDTDFDDEDEFDETDEPPNRHAKQIVLLNSSNRFEAMNGMKFMHIHPDSVEDPVYPNNNGQPLDSYSDEESGNTLDNATVGGVNEFDSQVETIDRQLSDFIKMIIQMRSLPACHGWSVVTRSCRSMLEVEGEVITAFLPTNNKRRSWHLITGCNGEERYRQIAWVEIELGKDQFIYLVEMELKKSEVGRSTLLIVPKDGKYMPEKDFEVFLNMTAVQNRWPKSTHSWKSDAAQRKAKKYFDQYHQERLTHPTFVGEDGELSVNVIKRWAEGTANNIKNKIGFTTVSINNVG